MWLFIGCLFTKIFFLPIFKQNGQTVFSVLTDYATTVYATATGVDAGTIPCATP